MNARIYRDRQDGGAALAGLLKKYASKKDAVVLGLARGGVAVAREVADRLSLPLDVVVVRKIGMPGQEELAIGAVASGETCALNHELIRETSLPSSEVDRLIRLKKAEVVQRERLYRHGPPLDLNGRTALLVDDGLATGYTMRAAVAYVRGRGARKIVVAVPVGAAETCRLLRADVDEVVCPMQPEPFYAVGLWYEDFDPVEDEDVRELMHATKEGAPWKRR